MKMKNVKSYHVELMVVVSKVKHFHFRHQRSEDDQQFLVAQHCPRHSRHPEEKSVKFDK